MTESERKNSTDNDNRLNSAGIRGILREFAHTFLHLAILLASAGESGWINAWICAGMSLAYQAINSAVLYKFNPQLLNKRGNLINEDTKRFDKVFIAVYMPLALITSVVSGIDAVRFEWSHMSINFVLLGVVMYILAGILGTWAMSVNRHFEATVFMQGEDHRVCSSGPYKIVRHPGYTAAIVGSVSYPLILGSWWGLAPVGLLIIVFIVRTALEDRTLQKELPGYKEYTKITKYRLLPHLW